MLFITDLVQSAGDKLGEAIADKLMETRGGRRVSGVFMFALGALFVGLGIVWVVDGIEELIGLTERVSDDLGFPIFMGVLMFGFGLLLAGSGVFRMTEGAWSGRLRGKVMAFSYTSFVSIFYFLCLVGVAYGGKVLGVSGTRILVYGVLAVIGLAVVGVGLLSGLRGLRRALLTDATVYDAPRK